MPAPLVCYIRSLLQARKITCTAILRQFGYSHDKLTRFLQEKLAWKKWYRYLVVKLFGSLSGGWIILDDTVLAKTFGRVFHKAGWVFDSALERPVFGYNLVFVVWSNGTITIPLCWRWYRKYGKSKIELAQSLLKEARFVWHIQPQYVLMDGFYPARDIVNQLSGYSWYFVTKLKKNRIINCCRLDEDLTEEGDTTLGWLSDYCQVRVVKHDSRYLATNDLSLAQPDIAEWYGKRWAIEECFRYLKQELHFAKCQARSTTAQEKHLLCSVTGYLILQKERPKNQSLYATKEYFLLKQSWGYNRIKHYEAVLLAGA